MRLNVAVPFKDLLSAAPSGQLHVHIGSCIRRHISTSVIEEKLNRKLHDKAFDLIPLPVSFDDPRSSASSC